MRKVEQRAKRFLALDSRVAELRLQQGKIVHDQRLDPDPDVEGDPLDDLTRLVDRSRDTLLAYERVYLFCGDEGLVEGASFQAHVTAADAGKNRKWLAATVSKAGGRITVDRLRSILPTKDGEQRKPATVGEMARAVHVLSSNPEQSGEAIAQLITDNRALAREVATNRKASDTLYEERAAATAEKVRQRYGNTRPEKKDPDEAQFDRYLFINDNLADVRLTIRKVFTTLREYSPERREAERWSQTVQEIISLSNGVLDELSGITEFNEELVALLEHEDQ